MRGATALFCCISLLGCAGAASDARDAATARRLDVARSEITPPLGATVSTLDQQRLQGQPQGGNRALAGSLAQLPGVAVGPRGQVIVRGQ